MKLRIWQYIQMNNTDIQLLNVINTLINIIGIEHFCMHVSYYKYISKLKLEVGIDVRI